MRMMATFFAAMTLGACQPADQPAPEPTPEEMGQDEPGVAFTPAPVGPPKTYDAMSRTAMSITPGVLTLTPTPQASPNLPEGAVFAFGNGYILKTTLMPGGAVQGATPYNFSEFTNDDGTPVDPEAIQMYSVDSETVPAGAPNGGFCDKTSFLATHTKVSQGAEDITIAAFNGDQWPPVAETALCGTFSYSRVP